MDTHHVTIVNTFIDGDGYGSGYANPTDAEPGATVHIGWTVLPGYTIMENEWYAEDKDGNEVMLNWDSATMSLTFTMGESDVTVYLAFGFATYSVDITTDGNGTASTEYAMYQEGETVYVVTVPNPGYELDLVTVTDDDGAIPVTITSDGVVSFTMRTSNVQVFLSWRVA